MSQKVLRNSYTLFGSSIGGDNPRAIASGLSHVQADKPWYNFFTTFISVDYCIIDFTAVISVNLAQQLCMHFMLKFTIFVKVDVFLANSL